MLAIRMPVLPPTLVVTQKLRALGEHYCDLRRATAPGCARRSANASNGTKFGKQKPPRTTFASAFLVLADRLGITQ